MLIPDIQLRFLVQPKVYGTAWDVALFAGIVPTLFNLAWIGLFFWFSLAFLPKRWGRIFYIFVGSIFLIYSFAQYIYFQIFGQFLRLNTLSVAGEGAEYLSYAFSQADGWLITLTLLSVTLLVFTAILWNPPKKCGIVAKSCVLVPVVVLVLVNLFMQPSLFNDTEGSWDSWGKPRVIYQKFNDANKSMDVSGLYQFAARDIWGTCFRRTDYTQEDFQRVDSFFAQKKENSIPNEYTGSLEGKNVIAVMLEGIDDWMISEKYTPAMKYMMDNGINLSNHYAPTFGTGYTLGSEFCFNTGYYTPSSAASAVYYGDNYYPYALPNLFRQKGYSAESFHYNNSEFYNRQIIHNSLGYEKYHSFMDYGFSELEAQSDSRILSKDEIYHDMVDNAPFFSFVITYSGHVPYTWDDTKLSLAKYNHPDLVDEAMDLEKNNCLLLAKDTDDFFAQLLTRLHNDGLLEDTVIVAYTDHYAYGFSDSDKLLEYNCRAGDDLMLRVPAFIYSPCLEPLTVTKPTATYDLLPTLVNLLGLENNYCYIGNDILDPDNFGFIYFENYWIEGEESGEEFRFDMYSHGESSQKDRIQRGNKRIEELVDINNIVIDGNYFAR